MKNLPENELIHLILRKIPIVFWTVDKNLKYTSSFGGGLKDLGLKENQVVGQSLFEYFQTDDENFLPIDAHLKALQGEKCEYIFRFGKLTFKSYVEPIYNEQNEIVGVIGFAINITEQEIIYENLKVSEAKYKALFESADDAIFLMDGEIFIDCNSAILRMFNCNRDDIIGQPLY
ncbi:MAG: PAS domain-containing protein, partial [Ignavibacteria bacterium]